MRRLIFSVSATMLLLTAPLRASAIYQVEPFSLKMESGEEIMVFTYPQKDAVSISLKLTVPGGLKYYITALHTPGTGTQVTVVGAQGRSYRLRRSATKEVAMYDEGDKVIGGDRKLTAECAAFYDKVESLREVIATKVGANQAVSVEAVGAQALQNIVDGIKHLAGK